MLTFYLSILFS